VDLEPVIAAAVEAGVWLEVNAQPERLDLDDAACRMAVAAGATIAIDTDAHATAELGFMRWGVDQARRGWATAERVANTLPLARLLERLHRARR
jgi:DNA polymerase (family 10)